MDPLHQTHQNQPAIDQTVVENNGGGGGGGGGGAKGGGGGGSGSTRWKPTTDQITILKELYNAEIQSPNLDQINKISANLRKYGKIESKNVFYWFQNRKARERQKKKFTTTNTSTASATTGFSSTTPCATGFVPANGQMGSYGYGPSTMEKSFRNRKARARQKKRFTTTITRTAGFSSTTPCATAFVPANGQMGSYGYGSSTMKKSFRNYWISSAGGEGSSGGSISYNYGSSWAPSLDHHHQPYSNYKRDQDLQADQIETLPLFPVHREDMNNEFCNLKHQTQTQTTFLLHKLLSIN